MKTELEIKNKIYVIGSIASDKSILAQKIAKENNIPLYEEEAIVHDCNKKRSEYERDRLFSHIIASQSWVIEGEYEDCFFEGIQKADTIIILDPSMRWLKLKILFMWLKDKLVTVNPCYTPSFRILILMFRQSERNQIKRKSLIQQLQDSKTKYLIVKSRRDLEHKKILFNT